MTKILNLAYKNWAIHLELISNRYDLFIKKTKMAIKKLTIIFIFFTFLMFNSNIVFAQNTIILEDATSTDPFLIQNNQDETILKTFPNGVQVELSIAKNSFQGDVKLSISQLKLTNSNNPLARYDAIILGSTAFEISAIDNAGKEIIKLNNKITAEITYPETYSIDSSSTGAYYFDIVSPKWILIQDTILNPSPRNITMETDRLYPIGIFNVSQLPDILKIKENAKTARALLDFGDRNLLRDETTGRIYIITQNKKVYISNIEELKRYPGVPVYNVTLSQLDSYPLVDLIALRDRPYSGNILLQNTDTNKIYLIVNGMKKYLPNTEEARRYRQFETITANNEIISRYPLLK
ncbi:MAG: hypothetical protein WCV92_00805 [Candidatus Buchananbacteria bacterium]